MVNQARGLRLANSGREAWLDITEKTLNEHQSNLEVRLAETHALIKTLKARLENENYIAKAPTELVDETRTQLIQKQALVERLEHELDILK
jgi:valyl-tRNA synthetase